MKEVQTYEELSEYFKANELKKGFEQIDQIRKDDADWIKFLRNLRKEHIKFIQDNLAKNILNELFDFFQIFSNFKDIRVVEVKGIQNVDISYKRMINLSDTKIVSVPSKAQVNGIIKYLFIPDNGLEPYDEYREIIFNTFFNLEFVKLGDEIDAKPKDLSYIILEH